jgi:hypothetical protein
MNRALKSNFDQQSLLLALFLVPYGYDKWSSSLLLRLSQGFEITVQQIFRF